MLGCAQESEVFSFYLSLSLSLALSTNKLLSNYIIKVYLMEMVRASVGHAPGTNQREGKQAEQQSQL